MHKYMETYGRYLVFSSILLFVASCGKIEKVDGSKGLQSGTPSALEAQEEMFEVLEGSQRAILGALLPSSGIGAFGCKPEINFVLIGLNLRFVPSDTCKFSGDINIKLFPLVAQVDLDVIGLKYVQSIKFDADVQLGGSDAETQIDFEILDGRIHLGGSLPIGDLVLNGAVSFHNGPAAFQLASRVNAFEAITSAGVAFIAQIDKDKTTGTRTRSIKGCVFTGGVPDDPNAGSIGKCLELGG